MEIHESSREGPDPQEHARVDTPPQAVTTQAAAPVIRQPAEQPQPPPAGARDHMAGERTLLAWARTAISVMGLGFVVAKFTSALRESGSPSAVANTSGVGMVLCGLVILGLGYLSYRRREEDMRQNRFDTSPTINLVLLGVLTLVGVTLAVYLIIGK